MNEHAYKTDDLIDFSITKLNSNDFCNTENTKMKVNKKLNEVMKSY